ncbi:MaoC/PaaZ C-terminal domain-containing protein [Paeniroseomonas aquatica]|uniref:MaoC/PaaZ C-terminal domain-containing protein n=2 Tax=Paeniroseomonas aquatica TaxID=373043 RepID=A0ABT8AAQ3_9PROT|nr:MaoC/PaaZ C-terminal domain-containing protein [Paeniroseomonas aquatica]MDN3566748.1 MaoC/PaaZ C-terminal domain-containing protein [Paeniroseomonas aquatica]
MIPETGEMPMAYQVSAYNLSATSENKIHDDTVAKRFGFTGALVPGVEVYAYACHAAVARWGRDWLERGAAECRFQSPVYDGDLVTVEETVAAEGIGLLVRREAATCATGRAWMPEEDPPAMGETRWQAPPSQRPPASEDSLAPGLWLGTHPFEVTPARAAEYLAAVRETDPLYAAAGLVHPGLLLRQCNQALVQNVVLGPWIHVGSAVRNLAAARVGDVLTTRARVTANAERKGHKIVELDAWVLRGDGVPLARVAHTAIWRPRQAA